MSTILLFTFTLICFSIFLFFYNQRYASLLVGFLFWCTLISFGFTAFYFTVTHFANNPIIQKIAYLLALVAAILILIVTIFGIYLLIFLLLLNARSVAKHERKSLSNRLTLITSFALMIFVALSWIFRISSLPIWVRYLQYALTGIIVYFAFYILLFLTTNWLCNWYFPRKNKDFIIVLGSGLINGKVPPLLAKRIDKAISFYQKQAKKRTPPTLVFSGGQGTDEPLPEAIAMQEYALAHGIPKNHTLVEINSKNTFENMKFSKELIEQNTPNSKKIHCIYATSNYHILRSANYARKANFPMKGIGAKTKLYYLPNALIREFLAYVWMHKKITIFFSVFSVFIGIFPLLLDIFIHSVA